MKIEIDTKAKYIRVLEPVNLGEFVETVSTITSSSHEDWQAWTLDTRTNDMDIKDYLQKCRKIPIEDEFYTSSPYPIITYTC